MSKPTEIERPIGLLRAEEVAVDLRWFARSLVFRFTVAETGQRQVKGTDLKRLTDVHLQMLPDITAGFSVVLNQCFRIYVSRVPLISPLVKAHTYLQRQHMKYST